MGDSHTGDGEPGPREVPEEYTRVPVDDLGTLEQHLREVGGSVEATDEAVRLESGRAHLTVTREGNVDTGMPLHTFQTDGVDALYVDTDRGRVRVYGPEGLSYEFRTP